MSTSNCYIAVVVHECGQLVRLNVKITMTDRLTDWLADWLTGRLTDWPTDWLADWLIGRLTKTGLNKCQHREKLCLRVLYEVKKKPYVEPTCGRPSDRDLVSAATLFVGFSLNRQRSSLPAAAQPASVSWKSVPWQSRCTEPRELAVERLTRSA